MTDTEDDLSIASDASDESVLTAIENDQSHKVDSTSTFMSTTALPEELQCIDYDHTLIQSVHPSLIQPVEPLSDSLRKSKDRERRIPVLL